MKKFWIILISGFCLSSFAQENNYWFANFGVVSTLKGGIEVGGTREVSAAYYNPGALAFIDGEFFEAQADLITMENLDISNAGGDGVDLNLFTLDVAPSIVGYMKRINKNPRIAYAIGILTRYSSNLAFDLVYEDLGNYLSPADEEDVFQGQYRYDNRIRESWVFGSLAYRVSDKVALGLGTNLYIRAQDYFKSYSASAFPFNDLDEMDPLSNLASNDEEQKFNYRVMGFIFKPSVSMKFDDLKIGMTINTPALNLGLLNNAAYRSEVSFMPDNEDKFRSLNDVNEDFRGVYKTPLSISLGAEQEIGKFKIAIAGEWFSSIDPYEMIAKRSNSQDLQYPTGGSPEFAIPVMAHRSVVNYGFSVQYEIKEGISYIGSYRRDNNYFDNGVL